MVLKRIDTEQPTVLIVDDEQSIVLHLKELVRGFGYRALFTTNPDFIFPILQEEDVDLILLDFNLKTTTGLEVLKEIQANNRHARIPVIFLTGETGEEVLGSCFDAGASDYLNKPVKEIELRARIHSCLQITKERKRYQELLLHVLPKEISEEILFQGETRPRYHHQVTVGFTDFTNFSGSVVTWPPGRVVETLQHFFRHFDEIVNDFHLTTIKTIGDAYMFAGGLFEDLNCQANECVQAAIAIRDVTSKLVSEGGGDLKGWDIRIGIHVGPAVSGVLDGNKIAHDLWGDTVNVAQRLEATCTPGQVQLSKEIHSLLPDELQGRVSQGQVNLKGIGEIGTFLIT